MWPSKQASKQPIKSNWCGYAWLKGVSSKGEQQQLTWEREEENLPGLTTKQQCQCHQQQNNEDTTNNDASANKNNKKLSV